MGGFRKTISEAIKTENVHIFTSGEEEVSGGGWTTRNGNYNRHSIIFQVKFKLRVNKWASRGSQLEVTSSQQKQARDAALSTESDNHHHNKNSRDDKEKNKLPEKLVSSCGIMDFVLFPF